MPLYIGSKKNLWRQRKFGGGAVKNKGFKGELGKSRGWFVWVEAAGGGGI